MKRLPIILVFATMLSMMANWQVQVYPPKVTVNKATAITKTKSAPAEKAVVPVAEPTAVVAPAETPAPVQPPVVPSMDSKAIMEAAGIAESDYYYVDYIFSHESRWCPTRWQGFYGDCPATYSPDRSLEDDSIGYGLCQSTPAIKMAVMGDGWQTDPVLQLKWCTQHMQGSYGSWYAAYQHWLSYKWW